MTAIKQFLVTLVLGPLIALGVAVAVLMYWSMFAFFGALHVLTYPFRANA